MGTEVLPVIASAQREAISINCAEIASSRVALLAMTRAAMSFAAKFCSSQHLPRAGEVFRCIDAERDGVDQRHVDAQARFYKTELFKLFS